MSNSNWFGTGSANLKAGIRDAENRLVHRRTEIGRTIGKLASDIREQATSPGALLAAGMVGAAIHRQHRLRGLVAVAILPAVRAGLRFLIDERPVDDSLSPREKRTYDAAENEFTAEGAPVQSPQTASQD